MIFIFIFCVYTTIHQIIIPSTPLKLPEPSTPSKHRCCKTIIVGERIFLQLINYLIVHMIIIGLFPWLALQISVQIITIICIIIMIILIFIQIFLQPRNYYQPSKQLFAEITYLLYMTIIKTIIHNISQQTIYIYNC